MKKNSLPVFYILIVCFCFMIPFFPLSLWGITEEENIGSSSAHHEQRHYAPTEDVEGKSLKTLTAEWLVSPFIPSLKAALEDAMKLKQIALQQQERERQEFLRQGNIQAFLLSGTLSQIIPTNDPIYDTEEGQTLKLRIREALKPFSFIVSREASELIHFSIDESEVQFVLNLPRTLDLDDHILSIVKQGILNYLSSEERQLLPVDDLIARVLYWNDSSSLLTMPALRAEDYLTIVIRRDDPTS